MEEREHSVCRTKSGLLLWPRVQRSRSPVPAEMVTSERLWCAQGGTFVINHQVLQLCHWRTQILFMFVVDVGVLCLRVLLRSTLFGSRTFITWIYWIILCAVLRPADYVSLHQVSSSFRLWGPHSLIPTDEWMDGWLWISPVVLLTCDRSWLLHHRICHTGEQCWEELGVCRLTTRWSADQIFH